MNSELTRPDGRKLLIITGATIVVAIILAIIMQTAFSAPGPDDVVDEDTDSDEETETTDSTHETVIPEEDISITVSAVGDIIVHDAQLNSMFDNETNDYNFNPAFDHVRSILSESDLAIGNMYGVFAGGENTHSGYPSFNTPDAMAAALESAGFDLIVGANRTTMNFGLEGISRTHEVLTKAGIEPVGIYENGAGSDAVYMEVNGIMIAFVAYSEHVDGYNNQNIPFEEAAERVGIMNESTIKADLEAVRKNNPDFIFAYMNWGEEFQYEISEMQLHYTDLLAENGVDVVVGSYPKNIQRTQYVAGMMPGTTVAEGKETAEAAEAGEDGGDDTAAAAGDTEHETFVAYSLGNFFSNQREETLGEGYEPTEDGVIMNFEITKEAGTGDTVLTNVDYIPTWTYRHSENNKVPFTYEILPIEDTLSKEDTDYSEDILGRLDDSLTRTEVRLNLDQARNPSANTETNNDDSEEDTEADADSEDEEADAADTDSEDEEATDTE